MAKTYTLSTITTDAEGRITVAEVGSFADKAKAMAAAKRAARTRKGCENYGPTSLCYVGRGITAVVAW